MSPEGNREPDDISKPENETDSFVQNPAGVLKDEELKQEDRQSDLDVISRDEEGIRDELRETFRQQNLADSSVIDKTQQDLLQRLQQEAALTGEIQESEARLRAAIDHDPNLKVLVARIRAISMNDSHIHDLVHEAKQQDWAQSYTDEDFDLILELAFADRL